MTARDLSPLLRRLNHHCAQALEDAVALCETRAHPDIEIEHWLLKLLELGDGDLIAILRRYEIDVDAIWNSLLGAIDRLPHALRGKPGLSHRFAQLLRAAWMLASLEQGQTAIRSAHLLAALVDMPHLLRAPNAWPLLSVSAVQIQRLMPELDRISVEAPSLSADRPSNDIATNDVRGEPIQGSSEPAARLNTHKQSVSEALHRFTIDITQKAATAKLILPLAAMLKSAKWSISWRGVVRIIRSWWATLVSARPLSLKA
jgi:type VI secretion system protein VasG